VPLFPLFFVAVSKTNPKKHTYCHCITGRDSDNQSTIGVKSFDVNLDSQTASVVTDASVPYETVLATIKKTGKTVNAGEADGEAKDV
jgi:copper chaperone CopZ